MADDPMTFVNRFYPKSGQRDAFIALQIAESRRLGPQAREKGWLGNRILRAHDDETVVIVTSFRSDEARAAWAAMPEFAAHIDRISPLLERMESLPCDQVAGSGEV